MAVAMMRVKRDSFQYCRAFKPFFSVLMEWTYPNWIIADQLCCRLPGSSRHGFLGSQGPIVHRRALPKRVTEQSYR